MEPEHVIRRGLQHLPGNTIGRSYTKLNSSLEPATVYTDASVASGTTYYYVSTAVDANNVESVYSNQAVAQIPTP